MKREFLSSNLNIVPWLVLAFCLMITFLLWRAEQHIFKNRSQELFQLQTKEIESAIETRLRSYELMLRGCVGLFNSSEAIEKHEWKTYVQALDPDRNYPGIQGIGFAQRVSDSEKDAHIRQLRAEGFSEYTIQPEGRRDEYFPIIYLEPFSGRNLRAFSYDMFSEQVRRTAMEKARDQGATAMSGKVTLVQETMEGIQQGFLIYLPLYAKNQPLATVQERRAALLGFVYSPFRANDFMKGIRMQAADAIAWNVYDGDDARSDMLLYSSLDGSAVASEGLISLHEKKSTIELFGKTWTFYFTALPSFEAGMDRTRLLVIVSFSLLFSLLLFAITFLIVARSKMLAAEIVRRERDQNELKRLHDELETRVQKRTEELKKTGQALAYERQRFIDVLDRLPVYVVLLTPDYHMPFANRFFRERFGEPQGRRCFEYLFCRNEPCEACDTYKVLKTGTPHQWEWTGPDKRDYSIFDFPFTDADGSPLILEMGIDVTEQKRMEEGLREVSRYARSLIEASLDPLVTISPEGKITDVNKATEKATGVSRTQLIGHDFSGYFTEPDKASAGYRKVLAEEYVRDYPLTLRHVSGRTTDVLYNAAVYRDEAGRVQGVFAAARDVTERRRAEAELRKYRDHLEELVKQRTGELIAAGEEAVNEKKRLEAVMETLPVGVAILDERGGSIQSNLMYEQIWGGPSPSTQTISDFSAYKAWFIDTGKPVQPEEWGAARAVMHGETVIGQMMQIERFDGTRAFVSNSAVPIADSSGTIRGCAVAIMDINEIKHAEQRLDLLAETASSLLKSDSPQQVVESLCRKVLAFLDCQAFFNFLADEENNRLRLNAWAGIPAEEARRIEWLDYGVAVCGCAARDGSRIVAEDIMNTPDIRTELVKSYGIQAYACHPLISQGEVLGTLSFGTRTRPCFSDDDLELMKAVTDQVAIAMERKRAEKQIEATNRRLRDEINQHQRTMEVLQRTQYAVDNAGIGIYWIGPDARILYGNNRGARWLGYSREEITGLSISDINPDHPPDLWMRHWKELTEKETMLFEARLRRRDGSRFPVEISANYLRFGDMEYNCAFVRDITERKQTEEQIRNALRENEVLMNEIHHRVKNNMQVIAGMLSLQAEGVQHEEFRGIIENCKNRISAMALVHDKLFRLGKLAEIEMPEYLTELARSLGDIYHKDLQQIELDMDIEPLQLKVGTVIPLGLVVNEILANSFKHAFPDKQQGRIWLKLHRVAEQEVLLEVGDDGVGMPEYRDPQKLASLGLRLIRGMVQHQLKGSLEIKSSGGTQYRIGFRAQG